MFEFIEKQDQLTWEPHLSCYGLCGTFPAHVMWSLSICILLKIIGTEHLIKVLNMPKAVTVKKKKEYKRIQTMLLMRRDNRGCNPTGSPL